MWSSNWVRFIGVLEPLALCWSREEDAVRVLSSTHGHLISVPLTIVESDPDEAREMVVTAVALLNLFE
jgi:hypothetical protein